MIRFPQILHGKQDKNLLVFNNIPFAKYNKFYTPDDSKKTGFLTEHTLFFVMQGTKFFYFKDHKVSVHKGNYILLKRGIYTMSELLSDGEPFEALMIFISDKFLKDFYQEYVVPEPRTKKEELHYVSIDPFDLLENFKNQYLEYFGKSFYNLEEILKLKLYELFLLLTSSPNKNAIINFIHSATYYERIDIDFILREHIFQPLSVDELAKLSGRSLASFKRDFNNKYNASPKQWINENRLAHSYKYVCNTDKSVSEIAYECGFEDVSYFIKLFKRKYSLTPAKLRAKITMS